AETLRKFKYFHKISRKASRHYVRIITVIMILVAFYLGVSFFMNRFNSDIHDNDSTIRLTVDTIDQRTKLSASMLDAQYSSLEKSVAIETKLTAIYLNNTDRVNWVNAIDLLTDKDDNVEFFYIENNEVSFASSNAGGIGLTNDELERLTAEGSYTRSVNDNTDLYAALPIYNGYLVGMYRAIGDYSALSARSIYNYSQNVPNGGLLVYNKHDGSLYQNEHAYLSERNINDLDLKPVFENSVLITDDDAHYSVSELLHSLDDYRVYSLDITDDARVTAYYSVRDCFRSALSDIALPLAYFVFASAMIVGSAATLRIVRSSARRENEIIRIGKKYALDKLIVSRSLSLFVIAAVIVAAIMTYVTALTDISRRSMQASSNLENITHDEAYNLENANKYIGIRDQFLTDDLSKASRLIEADEKFRTPELLSEIADTLEVCSDISLFDSNSYCLASSNGYSGYKLDSEDELSKQLNGNNAKNVYLTEPDSDNISYFGIRSHYNSGIIRFTAVNDQFQAIIERLNVSSTLIEADFGSSDVLYYDTEAPTTLKLAESGSHDIKTIQNSLDASVLHDNYFGIAELDGKRCFINIASDTNRSGNYFLSAWRTSNLIASISDIIIYFIKCSVMLLMVTLLLFIPFNTEKEPVIENDAAAEKPKSIFVPVGSVIINAAAASDTSDINMSKDLSPDKKNDIPEDDTPAAENKPGAFADTNTLKLLYKSGIEYAEYSFGSSVNTLTAGCIIMFLIYLVFGLVTGNQTGSLIHYLFTPTRERGVNIFSVTLSMIYIFGIWALSSLLRNITATISKNTGPAGLTVGKLIESFIKFAALILTILLVLSELGVKTGSLIAGAGLTSVIIGIGAQSTVGDILSGLFIIFEGHFRVGDIVSINGWTGIIKEIGMRTMTIESTGYSTDYKNQRIINNSDFKDVTNLSRNPSYAVSDIAVPVDADVELIRKLFEAHKTELSNYLDNILDEPVFDGVLDYGDYYKRVRFRVLCEEYDRSGNATLLTRFMGRILEENKLILNVDVFHTRPNRTV
ncbi:MAG: mechanosensitive ion channel, partial [Eubacteriales bacterium]|nr:mechanosensitive ion channel [Eubacteriales bacterium]